MFVCKTIKLRCDDHESSIRLEWLNENFYCAIQLLWVEMFENVKWYDRAKGTSGELLDLVVQDRGWIAQLCLWESKCGSVESINLSGGVSLEMSVPVPQPKSRMWLESRYFFARRLYQPSADSREGWFHQFLLDNWRMRNSWRVSNNPQNFWECFVGWTPLRNITIYYCFRVWCVCRSSLVFSKYWLRNPPWLTEFTQK